MHRITFRAAGVLLSLLAAACADPVTPPPAAAADVATLSAAQLSLATVREEGWDGGAIVLNAGEGQPTPTCFFQGTFFSTQGTVSRSPSGNWTLNCSFENLPEIPEQQSLTGWLCSIIGDPSAQTHHSSWVRSPAGTAHLSCHFSDKPIQDVTVSFLETTTLGQQAAFSLPLADVGNVPGQRISGETVHVGLGCAPLGDLTGKVVVAERGVCSFTQKALNALNAGAVALVVYNSAPFGDQVIIMGGAPQVPLPSVFIGRTAGLALVAASPTTVTISACGRSASCRGEL